MTPPWIGSLILLGLRQLEERSSNQEIRVSHLRKENPPDRIKADPSTELALTFLRIWLT